MLSLFAQAQQNGVVEYMYIQRNNGLVDSVAVAEIDSVTFAFQGVPEIPDTPVTPPAETLYEAVDLGLSVKWATHNVGASKPEEYGGYYAWGEVEEKEDYSWWTYKLCNGSYDTMTKYCIDSSHGTVDNKTTLDPEDDVATVKCGGNWRMPTKVEQEELRDNCTWTWTTLNGVSGYTVTGPNGNSIFLPAAGYRSGTNLLTSGIFGYYWSSSLDSAHSSGTYGLDLYGNGNGGDDRFVGYDCYGSCVRYCGRCVRPVCSEAIAPVVNYTLSVSSDENGAVAIDGAVGDLVTVADGATVTVTATANDGYKFIGWFVGDNETAVSTDAEYTFTVTENITLISKFDLINYNGHEYVDLGLPTGIKWATCNVGATKPEEYGGYYAWGETEEKENYEWSTYKWWNVTSNTITKYCINSRYGTVDNKTVLDLEDDVANVKWGGDWRMPTLEEQKELCTSCTWTWTSLNGVNGYTVTGPNGNSIFLPAAGNRNGTYLNYSGSSSYYWSSSLYDNSGYAYYLYFDSGDYDWSNNSRYYGRSVRPVSK